MGLNTDDYNKYLLGNTKPAQAGHHQESTGFQRVGAEQLEVPRRCAPLYTHSTARGPSPGCSQKEKDLSPKQEESPPAATESSHPGDRFCPHHPSPKLRSHYLLFSPAAKADGKPLQETLH